MRAMWHVPLGLLVMVSLAQGAAAQESDGYRYIMIAVELDLDGDGVASQYKTRVRGINQRGDVVGSYKSDADFPPERAFLRTRSGRIHLIAVPGDDSDTFVRDTHLTGINDDRAVIGFSTLTGPFLADAEGFHPVAIDLTGINDAWESVGNRWDARGVLRSFLRDQDGRLHLLDVPGPVSGINNHGEIVGNYADSAAGFLRGADGAVTPIAVPGAIDTTVLGLNTNLEIVGMYTALDGTGNKIIASFMRDADGHFVRIAVPGGKNTVATDINDEGRVVGYWSRPDSPNWPVDAAQFEIRGFVAIPCRVSPDRPACIPVTRIGE